MATDTPNVHIRYHHSVKIIVTGITLFAIEFVAMATMYFIDARDFICERRFLYTYYWS